MCTTFDHVTANTLQSSRSKGQRSRSQSDVTYQMIYWCILGLVIKGQKYWRDVGRLLVAMILLLLPTFLLEMFFIVISLTHVLLNKLIFFFDKSNSLYFIFLFLLIVNHNTPTTVVAASFNKEKV